MDETSLQHCMEVWDSAKGLADWGHCSPVQKEGLEGVCLVQTPHPRRVRLIVKPQMEEEQCRFHPGH